MNWWKQPGFRVHPNVPWGSSSRPSSTGAPLGMKGKSCCCNKPWSNSTWPSLQSENPSDSPLLDRTLWTDITPSLWRFFPTSQVDGFPNFFFWLIRNTQMHMFFICSLGYVMPPIKDFTINKQTFSLLPEICSLKFAYFLDRIPAYIHRKRQWARKWEPLTSV